MSKVTQLSGLGFECYTDVVRCTDVEGMLSIILESRLVLNHYRRYSLRPEARICLIVWNIEYDLSLLWCKLVQ